MKPATICASIIAAGCLLLLFVSLATAQVVTVGGGGDYLSAGSAGGYAGADVQIGMRGTDTRLGHGEIVTGYRYLSGNATTAAGATLDGEWHWHDYFATAGGDYLTVHTKLATANEFNWRAGAGVQFGWFRGTIRYETFGRSNGVSVGLGLDVPVWP